MKSIAIIGARLNSSRLPKKHLLSLAGEPLIHRLISRLQRCQTLDGIVLATTADDFNLPLAESVASLVPVVRFNGDVNDLMGRIDRVIAEHNPDFITYICGDCPLVEPRFIDHALSLLAASPDSDSLIMKESVDTIHEGMGFYSRQGWQKLMAVSQCSMSREHVGYGDKINPVLQRLAIDDCDDFSSVKHRISVDTQADYEFMQQVYTAWYAENDQSSIVDLKWVQNQLLANPELSSINQHVVQKKPDITYKKVSIYTHLSAEIGIGHFKRCQSIAESLKENLGLGVELHIVGSQMPGFQINSNTSWYPDLNAMLKQMDCDDNPLWILDFHPGFININQLQLTLKARRQATDLLILAIDKLVDIIDDVDELFIPSFYCQSSHPKISFGWDHFLLSSPAIVTPQNQLLVITGGSDALGYGEYLPALIESVVNTDTALHWVQGPLAPDPKIDRNSRWHIHKNPKNLPELIAQSKFIFSCYGLSLFESLCSGNSVLLLPVQHICSDEELAKLAEQHCCITTNFDNLEQHMAAVTQHPEQFDAMRKNAVQLLKPKVGLERLCQHVAHHLKLVDNSVSR